ncbi:hypothetical protein TWF694_005402 [Orbilia ellipsospora]|uniref:Uncharacterized protein n=1 Tax=Orbilia ellipsospora TaxID=2528407 RepID=A0AAV9WU71_9PEZI
MQSFKFLAFLFLSSVFVQAAPAPLPAAGMSTLSIRGSHNTAATKADVNNAAGKNTDTAMILVITTAASVIETIVSTTATTKFAVYKL